LGLHRDSTAVQSFLSSTHPAWTGVGPKELYDTGLGSVRPLLSLGSSPLAIVGSSWGGCAFLSEQEVPSIGDTCSPAVSPSGCSPSKCGLIFSPHDCSPADPQVRCIREEVTCL
jgi:hypothetical protein